MNSTVGPEDVRAAAAACKEALSNLVDLDWSGRAGDLDWSCRQTLEHIPNAQIFYASQLATTAKGRLPRASGGQDQLRKAKSDYEIYANYHHCRGYGRRSVSAGGGAVSKGDRLGKHVIPGRGVWPRCH